MRQIFIAKSAGYCFGVKRAVDSALKEKEENVKNIFTLGNLIHNNDVINYLMDKGIVPIEMEKFKSLTNDDVIIIRSHGITEELNNDLLGHNLKVVDATCPYVKNIQNIVKENYELGYKIIIMGDENHPEVIGLNGWCHNNAIITKDGSNLPEELEKVCIVSQTTERQENFQKLIDKVNKIAKEVKAVNTICNATSSRQQAAEKLAKEMDAMVVIGSFESSNTNKLYETTKKFCKDTIHVENATQIPMEFIKNKNYINIGVTAGASTPDWIIKEAVKKMKDEMNVEMNEQLAYMEENDNQVVLGNIVKGKVISVNDKNVYLNIGYKQDAIIPIEEISHEEVNLKDMFHDGDEVEAKVIKRKNEDGYVVLSTIELLRESAYNELKEIAKTENTVKVRVKEVVKGGIIALYKGIRIFIPASHVELYHVENLEEYTGKDLDVQIIEFDDSKKNTRIVGSRRSIMKKAKEEQTTKTWEKLENGMIVEGIVRRLTDFGAFVEVDGVDGLLHVSQISWGRVNKPSDVLKIGNVIVAKIIEIDKDEKKFSLSIKEAKEDPWTNVDVKYPVNAVVLGKVVRFADFGAFVELEEGVDAMVHVSEISNKRINKPSDVLEEGQQVKAKIIDVNKDNKKISLSMKAVEE